MKLSYDFDAEVFYFICSYPERAVPKGAGFRWNRKTSRWETRDKETACTLFEWATVEAYDLLFEYYQETAFERAVALEASRATDASIDIPAPEGMEYMPFQRAGIAYALRRDKTLIADEMGLGKTIQALGFINCIPEIEKFLIVCPAVVKINWYREAERWLVKPYRIQILNPGDRFDPHANGYIVNYDLLTGKTVQKPLSQKRLKCPFCKFPIDFEREGSLKVCIHYVEAERLDKKKYSFDKEASNIEAVHELRFNRFPELFSTKWDCLIADEVHYVKNRKALRSLALYKIADRAARVLFLTGTPIVNRPGELYPILSRLGLKMTYTAFMDRYAEGTQSRYGYQANGASNLDELQTMLRSKFMVRRLKADVLTDLPAKMRQVVELDPDNYADVLELERQVAAKHEKAMQEYHSLVKQAQEAGNTEAYKEQIRKLNEENFVGFADLARVRRETAVAKIKDSIAFIEEALESIDKILVFAHHKEVLNSVYQHFRAQAVIITGDTTQEKRQAYVDAFQQNSKVRVFVGSIQACGVGITLTAASNVLFLELDWTPANMTQAEDRAHRIGQKDCVNVTYLVVDGSLDAKLAKTIVRKENMIREALDDTKAVEGSGTLNIPPRPLPPPPVLRANTASLRQPEPQNNGTPDREGVIMCSESVPGVFYTSESREVIHDALKEIGRFCDGAFQNDGKGFNKHDADFGKSLCGLPGLTDKQAQAALRLVVKYSVQLSSPMFYKIKNLKEGL